MTIPESDVNCSDNVTVSYSRSIHGNLSDSVEAFRLKFSAPEVGLANNQPIL